jgi:hypothetical protein
MSILSSDAAHAGSVLSVNIALIAALLSVCVGQKQPSETHSEAVKSITAAPKLNPQQERGLRLLKSAEADVAGLQPDMRAFALWRASYAYVPVDPKKSEQLAENSFSAAQVIEQRDDDQCGSLGSAGDIQSWIEERVLDEFIRKDMISDVERLLPEANETARSHIAAQLVQHYVAKKDFSRALEILSQFADAADYPFGAAADLLLALGPERSADRMTIFNQALNNFEQHGNNGGFGQDDMSSFLGRTWNHVPPALALEAVDKMLDEAKSKGSHSHISKAPEKGSRDLSSDYQQRLFQLLPILQQLDKDRVDAILRDNAEARAQLAKYPKGMNSLKSEGNVYSYGITDDDAPQPTSMTGRQLELQIMQRMNQIDHESNRDPSQAIADALMLPLQGGFPSSSPRATALLNIAGNIEKKKPSLAKSALDEIMKISDQLNPQQIQSIADLPSKYAELGENDSAQKALKPLLKAAEQIYAHDIDADDPNKGFKGTWPSTELWRKSVQIAGKISPPLAEEVLADIPDQDIAVLEKISYAAGLLGASAPPTIVGDCRKNGASYNFSD